jgi:hypothetical protein
MPHCMLAPPADGVVVNGPGDPGDDQDASSANRSTLTPVQSGSRD